MATSYYVVIFKVNTYMTYVPRVHETLKYINIKLTNLMFINLNQILILVTFIFTR